MRGTTPRAQLPATARELLLLSSLFVAIIAALLSVTWASLSVLSSVRAYVAGESQYSKAQKSAVYSLVRYATTRDEADFDRYAREIAVPRADARARASLERRDADPATAERGFLEGRNAAPDVPDLITMFRRADWLDEMKQAIDRWREADAEVERLHLSALALHDEIRRESSDPASVAALLAAIDASDTRLTALQDAFSNTLGKGARRIRLLALGAATAVSVALLAIAILSTRRLLRRSRASDQLLRAMIDNVQDVITILEPDGTLVYASPALERILGHPRRNLLGSNLSALVHREDLESVEAALRPLATGPAPIARVEFRAHDAEGTWHTFAGIGSRLPREAGAAEIVLSARDVTDQRLMETQLMTSQKMDSIGRLAGGVAHDFNNLLTVILSSIDIAKADLPSDSDAKEALDAAIEAGRHATGLTRQLLSFARRQMTAPRVFEVMSVIHGLQSMLRRLLGDDISLVVEPGPEALHIRADPGQIEQVLVNLAANARDAMPSGGLLTITVARVTIDAGIASGTNDTAARAFVRIDVRDTGEAMSQEVRSHLFEPFFTTKEASKGTGLGLAICYGIVRQSGGHIEVESERGKGACFRIYLPSVAGSEEPRARAVETPGSDRGTETILLAEDEPAVRKVTVRALRDRGYRVIEAANGEEALQLARAEPTIHLLVTDVTMPRMGGRQLAAQLRAERPGVNLLFMSGIVDEDTQRTIAALDLQFLQKPFTPAILARKVREILDAPGA